MNKDQVKGRLEEVKGKVKEVAGKIVGNKSLELEGQVEEVGGKVRANVGALEQAISDDKPKKR